MTTCPHCNAPVIVLDMEDGEDVACDLEAVAGDWSGELVVERLTPLRGDARDRSKDWRHGARLFPNAPPTVTGHRPHVCGGYAGGAARRGPHATPDTTNR